MTSRALSSPPEWSHPLDVHHVTEAGYTCHLTANAEQRTALAQRLVLQALDRLEADLTLTRERGGLVVHVSGQLQADVVQKCVVTLEPVASHVEDSFEAFYADPQQAVSFARARAEIKAKQGEAEVPMLDERDAPEPIENGQIDLGELVAQYLSLAIDPYPRAPSVKDQIVGEDPAEHDIASPFAALKQWREGLKTEKDSENK